MYLACLPVIGVAEEGENPGKNHVFDLELISSAFGTFYLQDPQNQSWSSVEDGARIRYRGLNWQAATLKYHHRQFAFHDKALVDQMRFAAAKDGWCAFDTRDAELELLPVRALLHARSMNLESELINKQLHYKLHMIRCGKLEGRMRFRDKQWYSFNLRAQNMLLEALLKKNEQQLQEPLLQTFILNGLGRCILTQNNPDRSVKMQADKLRIDFDAGGFAYQFTLSGSQQEPARMSIQEALEKKTYAGSWLQVQLDTVGTLASLKCSADVRLSNKAISGDL